MGRWSQYDEDSYRLPEGVTRVAYDADTGRYTFRDRRGHTYQGAPGENYGVIKRVASTCPPSANFQPVQKNRSEELQPTEYSKEIDSPLSEMDSPPTTFQEILPPDRMVSLTSPVTNDSPTHSRSASLSARPDQSHANAFVSAARRTALPKMQGVVKNLRRSMTTTRRPENEESAGLLRRHTRASQSNASMGSGNLRRSASVATTSSFISTTSTKVEHDSEVPPPVPLKN